MENLILELLELASYLNEKPLSFSFINDFKFLMKSKNSIHFKELAFIGLWYENYGKLSKETKLKIFELFESYENGEI